MKFISSKSNPLFKSLLRIQSRRDTARIALEGVHLAQACHDHHIKPDLLCLTASAAEKAEVRVLTAEWEDIECIILDDRLFESLSHVPSPQGMLIVVARKALQREAVDYAKPALLLDCIQDPGNLGAIIRTAAAAHIKNLFLSSGCADSWSPKVLRSAQGAHFAVNIYEGNKLEEVISRFELPVYACALNAHAKSIYDENLSFPAVWVMGNEGQGIKPSVQAACAERVFIPQSAAVESLNVAVAAGIVLFEQKRRLG